MADVGDSTRGSATPGTVGGTITLSTEPDGRSAVLNLATGAVELRGTETPGTRLLHRQDLDVAQVASIFRGAGYDLQVHDRNHIIVEDREGETIIAVSTEIPIVAMWRYFTFRDEVSMPARHACANTVNGVLFAGRAFCDADGDLTLEAELHTGAGLSPAQLLAGYRFFLSEADGILALDDVYDLLEL